MIVTAHRLSFQVGLNRASPDRDWHAVHWRLFLWDPWFLGWGLLLGAATVGCIRQHPTRAVSGVAP